MKKYLIEVQNQIGKAKLVAYMVIVSIVYSLYSLQPYLLPRMYDLENDSINYFILILLLISFVSKTLLNYPNNFFLQSIRKNSKKVLWTKLSLENYENLSNKNVGEIQNLISEIAFSMRSIQYESFQNIFQSFIMLIVYTVIISLISPLLGVIYLILYIGYFCLSTYLFKENEQGIQDVLTSTAEINSYIIDYFRNLESVFSEQSLTEESSRFVRNLENERISYFNLQKKIDNVHLVLQFLISIMTIFLLWFSLQLIGELNFSLVLILIYSAFNMSDFGKSILQFLENKDRLKIGLKNIDFNSKEKKTDSLVFNSNDKELVVMKNISFSYGGRNVIKNFDLKIRDGERILLVGKNGTGKSTLLKIIANLYQIHSGSIEYNTTELEDDLKGISYYSQSMSLFDRSIFENIIYPCEEYNNIDEVKKIIKELNLDTLIQNESDLLNKTPGDFGKRFSGGEKQKLLLARAILNKKKVMLFDEIDSSIDQATKINLLNLLKKYLQGSTIIFVSHNNTNDEFFTRKIEL